MTLSLEFKTFDESRIKQGFGNVAAVAGLPHLVHVNKYLNRVGKLRSIAIDTLFKYLGPKSPFA